MACPTTIDMPLAVTMGEPAGIGGDIVLKAWRRGPRTVPPFLVIDDADRLSRLSDLLGLDVPVRTIDDPGEVISGFRRFLPVLHRPLHGPVTPGKPNPVTASAVLASIEEGVELVRRGRAAALVTNPIHKKVLYDAGFSFPGHTEFLASLAGGGHRPAMMLAGANLRVVPVTIHVGLRQAIDMLTIEHIIRCGVIVGDALVSDFGIARPRLAVAGLNPHAGEQGALGNEEQTIVGPAVDALRARGIDACGPLPPDTLFAPHVRHRFDAVLCMYHDQALIPIKALHFDTAVNVTLGLPFVRTSPDHGTALDIAGSGRADESSFVAALTLAAACAKRRAMRAAVA